jgi:hypothetical protein
MALNSTRPGRGTSLILYLGAVVMLGAPAEIEACQRELELQPRRTAPHPNLGTSSRPRRRSGEGTLRWLCLLYLGPSAAAAPQQVSSEPLGSQEPPALSQKAPLPMMLLAMRRVVTPGVVARFEVPADQWAVDRCSCMRYGECEPSII